VTVRAYGLEVDLRPHLAAGSHHGPVRRTLSASVAAGATRSEDSFWALESSEALTVGWAGYGECTVTGPANPAASVRTFGATPTDVACSLVMSVIPLALPLFDLEPLHGSAVRIDGSLLAVLGGSEAGKTTTAAHLVVRGHALAADDACAFDAHGNLWPGPPFLGLRDHALARTLPGQVVTEYDAKLVVEPERVVTEPAPVDAVVVLAPGADTSDIRVRVVEPRDATKVLFAQVRSPGTFTERRRPLQLATVAHLATKPVAVVEFTKGRHAGGAVAAAVEHWVGARTSPLAASNPGR